jgi:hypothetical protein
MIIDELPTGPFVTFLFTTLISWFFQFPGFLLTYLLHGTHAGRFGSQAGLALTLIQLGFGNTAREYEEGGNDGMILLPPLPVESGDGGDGMNPTPTMSPTQPPVPTGIPAEMIPDYTVDSSHEWVSFLLMTIGKSCHLYHQTHLIIINTVALSHSSHQAIQSNSIPSIRSILLL